jgi:ABC-type sugar transport system ATPase subunit
MSDAPFLSARGLAKRYPGVVALHGVDFDVAAGEIVALVGKNGAGKSTLIKTLAGAVRPDAGELRLDGDVVRLTSPIDAARLRLAFVHQELADFPDLSVAENVLLATGLPRRGGPFVDWTAARERAAAVLRELDDGIDPRAAVGSLSVAQRRLAMIAGALAQDARLLVLDEPSAALTTTEIDHLHAVVRRLAERGIAVVYVSHRLGETFALTTRTVVMRDGSVVADRPTSAFDAASLVREITGGDPLATESTSARPRARRADRPLLSARRLGRSGAVRDVTLDVHAGEIVGIAGLVGAGRTEMVRLLIGADRRTSGSVEVRGRAVAMRSPREAAGHGVVLLPEDRRNQGAIGAMSVRENVTLTALDRCRRARWLPAPSRRRETQVTASQVQTLQIKTGSVETSVSALSGGNQQKVVLAKWLARGADVFIFDEPTAGIDVNGRAEVYAQMRALAERGKGIVVVSSDFSEFAPVCDRVVVMRESRLVAEFEGSAIAEPALVAACYAD